jgi:hypothetical protein
MLLGLPASTCSEAWPILKFSAGIPAGVCRSSSRPISVPLKTIVLRFTRT